MTLRLPSQGSMSWQHQLWCLSLQAVRDLRHTRDLSISLRVTLHTGSVDFFGSMLHCLTRPTHRKHRSALVQLALQPSGAKAPAASLPPRCRQPSKRLVQGLTLDSIVLKLAPGSPPSPRPWRLHLIHLGTFCFASH